MYLIANFKNKLKKEDIIKYSKDISNIKTSNVDLVIAPSMPYLDYFNGINYELASQDITSFKDITLTGEVTGEQLKSMGVTYSIIGHSERRKYKKEINIDFINKINNCHDNNIKVVYCIGETLEEKENNKTLEVLEKEISEVLNNVDLKDIIIAYEPIWAIGSGTIPDIKELTSRIKYIKKIIRDKYEVNLPVLYGGSINSKTIVELKDIPKLDGFLVGGASLDPKELKCMILHLED